MRDTSKRIKRLLREQAMLAHEEELRRALLPLAAAFEEWKAGDLSSGELGVRIHEFHQGPSRQLFSKYNNEPLDAAVAYAIVSGILDASQGPDELLEYLSTAIAFYKKEEPTPSTRARYTPKQGQYLSFIYYYTKIHGLPPSEADMQRYFGGSPPAVHQMVLNLEARGLIERVPRTPRSVRLTVPRSDLPDLE